MKISIKVRPNAGESKVEEVAGGGFVVWVKAPARENRANKEAIEALAEYFNVPKSAVFIKSGLKSKQKIVEIGCEK